MKKTQKNKETIIQQKENNMIKIWLMLGCIFILVAIAIVCAKCFWNKSNDFKQEVIEVVSTKIGTEMKKDQYGNVNVLLLWYGGINHEWGYLTDSIIIASWNPEVWNVSMFSIPRDLYVKYPYGWYGKINGAFYQSFLHVKRDFNLAWEDIVKYFGKMVNMDIPYYAMVDFSSFKEVVDAVGGIDIDVPETLHDTAYPWPNKSYVTFHLDAGQQHLDGETALKYARSRHSTSDFSRSLRQQQIISWIKDKVLSAWLSVDLVQNLYDQYKTYVVTNISLQEMLRSVSYALKLESINSYGLTTNCGVQSHERMVPACLLYTPNRDDFGGASVILPDGADITNISNYKGIQKFFDFIVSNPRFGKEKAKVWIQNGIDKDLLRKKKLLNVKIAGNFAVKLKKYGFTIGEIDNTSTGAESVIQINKAWDFSWTITAIQKIFPIQKIEFTQNALYSWRGEHTLLSWYELIPVDEQPTEDELENSDALTIILRDDYILGNSVFSGLAQKRFSFSL